MIADLPNAPLTPDPTSRRTRFGDSHRIFNELNMKVMQASEVPRQVNIMGVIRPPLSLHIPQQRTITSAGRLTRS